MPSATTVFGLTEIARVSVDDVDYVLADDGVYVDAVDADAYDNVPETYEASDYSLWCAEAGPGVGDVALFRRILRAAGRTYANSGACGGVHAYTLPTGEGIEVGEWLVCEGAGDALSWGEITGLADGKVSIAWDGGTGTDVDPETLADCVLFSTRSEAERYFDDLWAERNDG